MAEEQEEPEIAEEPVEIEEEEQKPDPIADLASKMGWHPKDQFKGNPEEWRPADEFILASKDINRNLSKELRGMKDQIDRVSRTSAQILEDKIAERDQYWQRIHRQAVEEGNYEVAERAVSERQNLKAQRPEPVNTLPSETAEFIDRHKNWFNTDPLATTRAQEIAAKLAQQGYPVSEQLKQVERAIRKEFPEHFDAPAKQPAQVNTASARNANTTSRTKGFSDMPSEAQKIAVEFERKHGVKRDDYAKSYWADLAQSRRVSR